MHYCPRVVGRQVGSSAAQYLLLSGSNGDVSDASVVIVMPAAST